MIRVYKSKVFLQKRKKNGQRAYRWVLRWETPTGWKQESTGTADSVTAEALREAKFRELNLPATDAPIESLPVKPTWEVCSKQLRRAMETGNLRQTSVDDSLRVFSQLQKSFPSIDSPADITAEHANEFKRLRCEAKLSPWSIKGDLATLRAIFGKWLIQECNLLSSNPFANVRPPKCDAPQVKIISLAEYTALFAWFNLRWASWELPIIYFRIAMLLGWRASEVASLRSDDVTADGSIRVDATACKTRRDKYGYIPPELHSSLTQFSQDGWVFGKFPDELRRRLILVKKKANHAAMVKDFAPQRLVGWLQDELKRYFEEQVQLATAEERPLPEQFTLHDIRRTAITGMLTAGVSEKSCSVLVGCSPDVIRKHYEKMNLMQTAKRTVETRLSDPNATEFARLLRDGDQQPLDVPSPKSQTMPA